MDVAVLERPRTADRTSARGVPGGDRRWSLVAGVVVVLAGAVWSLTAVSTAVSPAGPGEVGLVGGVVHVDAVVSAARARHAMPGMGADDDPVAEDERRISVDVTLRADEDATLRFDPERFRLSPEGGTAQEPHKLVLPQAVLPEGSQLSGTLVFDVPADATTARLSYGEHGTSVELPAEATGAAPGPGAAAATGTHDAAH